MAKAAANRPTSTEKGIIKTELDEHRKSKFASIIADAVTEKSILIIPRIILTSLYNISQLLNANIVFDKYETNVTRGIYDAIST